MTKKGEFGLKGVVNTYSFKFLLAGVKYPILVSLVFIFLIPFGTVSTYDLLKIVIEKSLEITPNILGFLLSCYILFVGFGKNDFLKFISEASSTYNDKLSLFDDINSIFSICLLAQVLNLGLSFFTLYFMELKIIPSEFFIPYLNCFNLVYFFFVVFLFSYSIFSLKDTIIIVFNIGVAHKEFSKGTIKK